MFVYAEVLINPAVKKSQTKLGAEWVRRFTALAVRAKSDGDIGPVHSVESVISFLGSLSAGFFLSRGVWDAKPDVAEAEKLVDSFIGSIGHASR